MTDFHETTVRVRYVETDQMGVVYHSNFFVWFEIGRVELFRELGVVYKDMEEKDDCFIVVGECKCRFKRPARYDDLLRVRTRIAEAGSRKITFEYEIMNAESGELLATGETVHVICDKLGRSKSLPDAYKKLFGARKHAEAPVAAASHSHK
jgi:acyl-CoA thioester hydrolase